MAFVCCPPNGSAKQKDSEQEELPGLSPDMIARTPLGERHLLFCAPFFFLDFFLYPSFWPVTPHRLSFRVKRLVLYDGAPRPVCLNVVCALATLLRDKNDGHSASVCSSLLSHGQEQERERLNCFSLSLAQPMARPTNWTLQGEKIPPFPSLQPR